MKTIISLFFVKIMFVDVQTNETLPGVKIQTEHKTYYSDLEGYVLIPKNEKILDISSISYKPINNIELINDTTINLN
jgi:hypothetical protein